MSSRRGGRGGGRGRGKQRAQRDRDNDDDDANGIDGEASGGMTAFNMEDEKDEGHFDDDGNFVWNKEDKRVQEEAWLDDVDEEQIGAAMAAKNQRAFRDEQAADETMTDDAANRILATLLQPRESVLRALQRLGSKRPKRRGLKRKHQQQQPLADAPPAKQTADEKRQFDQVTDAADFLLRRGDVDVYSQLREEFIPEAELLAQRSRSRDPDDRASADTSRVTFALEGDENEESKSEAQTPILWEYRGADGAIHGPFPSATIVAWQAGGYFTGDSAVDIRQVGSNTNAATTGAAGAAPEEVKISAEQELLNDFEDSDDDDNDEEHKTMSEATATAATSNSEDANPNAWRRSDQVDFAAY